MNAEQRLYLLDVQCPRCGSPPRVRATAKQIEKWGLDAPHELVQTYQCSWEMGRGRPCNAIYALTAGAFQRATVCSVDAPTQTP